MGVDSGRPAPCMAALRYRPHQPGSANRRVTLLALRTRVPHPVLDFWMAVLRRTFPRRDSERACTLRLESACRVRRAAIPADSLVRNSAVPLVARDARSPGRDRWIPVPREQSAA